MSVTWTVNIADDWYYFVKITMYPPLIWIDFCSQAYLFESILNIAGIWFELTQWQCSELCLFYQWSEFCMWYTGRYSSCLWSQKYQVHVFADLKIPNRSFWHYNEYTTMYYFGTSSHIRSIEASDIDWIIRIYCSKTAFWECG